ncbi:SAM-dependent methyltransferase [Hydrogenophaga crassostreae]|uniref:SAM-dependent methyltransferase n=1 Tax=Hydrogenophaga crassostreae TaxID=1763535 RepID=A0A170AHV9_9BURK|nr:class I SAM-dependent methyltransferase [Hydrogenophaga crassostreae]AOW14057.1 SAM-dependent methyltransferase [Hydrogenophaga crassostreae]OAD43980.1 SAM-dependent methyltransferase [Hydrogenophaga crassostreae]
MQTLLTAIATMALPTDAQRIFHGRGGMHPGCEHLSFDWFSPAWLLTSFQPMEATQLTQVHQALIKRWTEIAPAGAPLNWAYQCRATGHAETRLMAGSVPDPHDVLEHGARYRVHLLKGQNHGLFLDMANGRQWVKECVRKQAGEAKVLNLFAYTCAFSIAALQGGAKQVVNVDMSAGAMGLGQLNHALNGFQSGASFLTHDIFKTWGKITRSGPYHLVIVDPPSFQKGSFIATKDYAKLMRRLPDLLRPGGQAMLCLNAPELSADFLQHQMAEIAPELVFEQRLDNPPVFTDVDPNRSLKVLIYRAPDLPPRTA